MLKFKLKYKGVNIQPKDIPGWQQAQIAGVRTGFDLGKDIEKILSTDLLACQLAVLLGVTRQAIWLWRTGKYYPSNPIMAFIIHNFAEYIRQEEVKLEAELNNNPDKEQ